MNLETWRPLSWRRMLKIILMRAYLLFIFIGLVVGTNATIPVKIKSDHGIYRRLVVKGIPTTPKIVPNFDAPTIPKNLDAPTIPKNFDVPTTQNKIEGPNTAKNLDGPNTAKNLEISDTLTHLEIPSTPRKKPKTSNLKKNTETPIYQLTEELKWISNILVKIKRSVKNSAIYQKNQGRLKRIQSLDDLQSLGISTDDIKKLYKVLPESKINH